VARGSHHSEANNAPPHPDRVLAAIAAQQHGVLTLAQLSDAGLGRGAIQRQIQTKRLQRLWRGVYTFGHREVRPDGRLLGALFACGRDTVLSHRTAANRWGLLTTVQTKIDVTVPRHQGRTGPPGIRLHCVRRLDPRDVTTHHGIPITTVARTLVDLNAVVPDRRLERALEQAYIRRLLPKGAIEDALERANGRRTRALRRLIAAESRTATVTRSELEERFLGLLRSAELPDPEINAWLCGYEVDFLWRAQRRVIEVDGHAYHSTRQAVTRDRRKDNDLETAGYGVTRFTADQILHDPEDTQARTRRVLCRAQ
jgi:very-short-patch-repair endonuclease